MEAGSGETMEEHFLKVYSHDLLSLLSYTLRKTPARSGASHSGLHIRPKSRKHHADMSTGQSNGGNSSVEVFFSWATFWFISNWQNLSNTNKREQERQTDKQDKWLIVKVQFEVFQVNTGGLGLPWRHDFPDDPASFQNPPQKKSDFMQKYFMEGGRNLKIGKEGMGE